MVRPTTGPYDRQEAERPIKHVGKKSGAKLALSYVGDVVDILSQPAIDQFRP